MGLYYTAQGIGGMTKTKIVNNVDTANRDSDTPLERTPTKHFYDIDHISRNPEIS